MGIKTRFVIGVPKLEFTLKNLPTTWGLRQRNCIFVWLAPISEKPPHHMGIKTLEEGEKVSAILPLKNLPTTWGLRHPIFTEFDVGTPLKNLPTTWGLRRAICSSTSAVPATLKNLPTTWGLRPDAPLSGNVFWALKNLPTTWGLRPS